MSRIRLAALIIIIGCTIVTTTRGHTWLAECDIAFDNEFALTTIYAQARATFAYSTGLTAAGQFEICDPARHGACWTYRERCGSRGYVNVEEKPRLVKRRVPTNVPGRYRIVIDVARYGHFHLGFQDPTVNCPFAPAADGLGSGFGREMGTSCIVADWKREPRIAMTHDSAQPLRVWVEDSSTHAPRMFDVVSINNRGGVASQVWFRTADGSQYGWPRLEPNVWNISADAWEIMELFISAAAGEIGPIAIDNIIVRN